MRNKINHIVLGSVLSLFISSCSFLDLEPNVIEASTYYNSEQEVQSGLAGVYGALGAEAVYGNYYSLMLSNIDDLSYSNRTSTNNFSQLYSHDASSTEIYEAWTKLYAGIGNANSFMEAIENSEYDPNHESYNEARFMRAYYHFLLAQAWGDVPLKKESTKSPEEVMCEATSQLDVLKWAAAEMEECLYSYIVPETDTEEEPEEGEPEAKITKADIPSDPTAPDPVLSEILANQDLSIAPSRVIPSTICGILSRVYLFMAGESIEGTTDDLKHEYFGKAMKYSKAVIDCGKHKLNESYSNVFINMIKDVYDRTYYESMWEVDFLGDRSSSASWTNGRIGDLNGLQSNAASDFANWACNYSYGYYNGSLKLFNLYYETDRTDADKALMAGISADMKAAGKTGVDLTVESVAEEYHWDQRQAWNMCPYNYNGNANFPPYPDATGKSDGNYTNITLKSYAKTPYNVGDVSTSEDPTVARGIRNCGKWRRETIYEAQMSAKDLYTCINYPLLRYSDVLLMYAEASNEFNGAPSQTAYDCVEEVRDRAGIETLGFGNYSDQETFRQFVRDERARELCFESLRKYDLIRWGIFVESMKDYLTDIQKEEWGSPNSTPTQAAKIIGQNVQERHILLPIPSIELGVNTSLTQNKLW